MAVRLHMYMLATMVSTIVIVLILLPYGSSRHKNTLTYCQLLRTKPATLNWSDVPAAQLEAVEQTTNDYWVPRLPIYIYWHIFVDSPRSHEIILRQWSLLANSGLMGAATAIRLSVVGNNTVVLGSLPREPKVHIVVSAAAGDECLATGSMRDAA